MATLEFPGALGSAPSVLAPQPHGAVSGRECLSRPDDRPETAPAQKKKFRCAGPSGNVESAESPAEAFRAAFRHTGAIRSPTAVDLG